MAGPAHLRSSEFLESVRAGQLAMLTTMALFGVNNVVIKQIGFGGLVVSGYRLLLGAILMSAVLWGFRRTLVTVEMIRRGWFGSVMYALTILMFFSALKLSSVANVAIIATLQAAFVLTFVNRLYGERVRAADVVLTGAALAGTAVVIIAGADSDTTSLAGDGLAFGAMFINTAYFIASKNARNHLDAIEYQTVAMVISAVIAFPIALLSGQALTGDGGDWVAIVYLATGGTIAHFCLNWAHPVVDLKFSSLLTLAVPIVTAALGWIVLGESLTAIQVAGMAVVIAALALAIARPST